MRGGNAALACIRAEAALFLHKDVELVPGAVAAALRCLGSDPRIGAVGGKVIRAHGLLHEAGGIVWRDGTIQAYQRDAFPLLPEANFRRDVAYCSRVFLLVRADLLRQLEGFDDAYAPGGYEDVDLCVRIQQAGFRVVYDPSVALYHMVHGSAPAGALPEADKARQRQVFCRRHAAWLQQRAAAGPAVGGGRAPRRGASAARAVHRGYAAVAPARLRLRAVQRPGPDDGRDGLWRDGLSGGARAASIWPRSMPTCPIRSR